MKYDFSTPIKRKDTDCVSMELMKQATGRDDLMPLWIADMGFPTPPFVIKAIEKRPEIGEKLGLYIKEVK